MIFPTELDEERSEEHILLMGLRTPFNERRWSQFSSINSLFNDKDPSKSVAVVPVLPEAKEESLESIKLCQKLEAISYKDIDEFAKLFVDEIIDISVGVCKNVKIVIGGSGEDYSKEGDEDETVVDIPEPDLDISEEDDFFPGWPIIAQFNVDLAILRIEQFMSNWRRKEAWTYSVFHEASWSDYLSDFHLFKKSSARPVSRKRSLDDIDELTYMLMLGTKGGGRRSTTAIASIMKKMTLSENKWIPETDALPQHFEVAHQMKQDIEAKEKEEEQAETSSGETIEEQVSEVSIPDKIRCIKFANIELFAEMFVDEIIDISVDVCENLFNTALGCEGEGGVTEIPCICDATKPPPEEKASLVDNSSLSSVEKKEFSGWPTIKHFTVDGTKKKIKEFMGQWYFVQDWKYTVQYIGSYSDTVADYHLFKGVWSIPSKEYPIAQATASIFFTIEVSRVKPKFCFVNVTLQFEGSSSVYKAGQFEFIEQWLFNIIDSKLNLFRTLKF